MSEFDTTALLEQVRDRGGLPANDARYSASVLLQFATTELRDYIFPMLVQARAEHGIYQYSTSVTAGTAAYRMPPRCMGGSLRDVIWTPSGGEAVQLTQKSSSEPAIISEADESGDPVAYFVRNYYVHLVRNPGTTGTVSMPYYARPNRLVPVADCAVVGSVSVVGSDYAIVAAATPPAPLQAAGAEFECVRATPGFETLLGDGISFDGTLTFNAPVASFLSAPVVGDYITVAGTAPVPQVPVEMLGLLAARVALVAVEGTGDTGGTIGGLQRQAAELELRARQWLSPRVESGNLAAGGNLSNNPLLGIAVGRWGR